MTDQPDQPLDDISAAQQNLMNAFYAVIGAPDDADAAATADEAVRALDVLLTPAVGTDT